MCRVPDGWPRERDARNENGWNFHTTVVSQWNWKKKVRTVLLSSWWILTMTDTSIRAIPSCPSRHAKGRRRRRWFRDSWERPTSFSHSLAIATDYRFIVTLGRLYYQRWVDCHAPLYRYFRLRKNSDFFCRIILLPIVLFFGPSICNWNYSAFSIVTDDENINYRII